MIMRMTHAIAAVVFATLAAERAAAQATPADVTFEVPVNLTRLPSEITKIMLRCELSSIAIAQGYGHTKPPRHRTAEVELPVSQSEVIQTVQVVVPLSTSELNNPSGKQATYECRLFGFHQSPYNAWHDLHFSSPSDAACRLTPKPAPITGSFVW